jgi:hypothetical protein
MPYRSISCSIDLYIVTFLHWQPAAALSSIIS